MTAIWNDTEYQFPDDELSYTIESDGNVLYQGRAYKFPDADSGSVLVNKVCKEYLYTEFPSLTGTTTHSGMTGTFTLKNDSGTTLGTYDFINDWNYDDKSYSANTNMNIPINGHLAANMYVFSTDYKTSGKRVQTTVQRANNPAFCGKYAIYYTNRRNAWDGFLFEGNVQREKDGFDHYEYDRFVLSSERNIKGEKVRYKNVIKKSFTLNTGWLSDAQAATFSRHLLSTNNAYLHNLETDEIMPCVITDSDAEYKRFKNDKKLVSYEINVECGNKEELA